MLGSGSRKQILKTYSRLESSDLLVCQSIGLGNDGNQVDLGVETLHDLNIERLQGVAGWLNEEDASVDAVVHDVHPVDLVLSIQVSIEALLDVVRDWPPGLVIVDEVTEARGINNGQSQTNAGFLDICADGLDGDSLGEDVETGPLALLGRVEGSVEQSVDKGRLSETRLAWNVLLVAMHYELERVRRVLTNNHNVEVEALANTLTVPLVGKVGKANVARQLSADNVLVLNHAR